MFASNHEIDLSDEERVELERLSRSRTVAASIVQRAQMVLAM